MAAFNSFKSKTFSYLQCLMTASFSYRTQRELVVRNKRVFFAYRITQLIVIFYVVWYQLIQNQEYQTIDSPTSTVVTKVKGYRMVNSTSILLQIREFLQNSFYYNPETSYFDEQSRILDTIETVIPPNEPESIFIMTSFIKTFQTKGKCPESPKIKGAMCQKSDDCFKFFELQHGIPTGNCVQSSYNGTKTCEIQGWCPVEDDSPQFYSHTDSSCDYTIFIKNNIEFPQFERREANIYNNMTRQYISTCLNDKISDPLCPVFSVRSILREAESDKSERRLIWKKGGVIEIVITWECYYDIFSSPCYPKYSFNRMDLPSRENSVASGFNFRFATKYVIRGKEFRTLYKAHGIRFFITVVGEGRKFDILCLTLAIGAGTELLCLSIFIGDMVLLKLTRSKNMYKKFKELDYRKQKLKKLKKNQKLITNSAPITNIVGIETSV